MTLVQIVENALTEDIGSGDITTTLCVPAELTARARIIARQPLVVAGVSLLPLLFENPEVLVHDCDCLNDGGEIARVRGPARILLTRERVALNFLQRLCGIATLTRKYVEAIAGTHCRILDTRKTAPGLRTLEKMATAAGGAVNHRMGLYDEVLIKNNHITAAGGVRAAFARVKDTTLPVEIEVRTTTELNEALECGASHLLLDNLTPDEAASWIRDIAGYATVELSGGITLETVRAYAETGADFISVGALTHSAPAADINFRLELDQ